MNEAAVKTIVTRVLKNLKSIVKIPIGVSNRHVHLTEADFQKLFPGKKQLTVKKELSQPGQFAANESVTVIGPKGEIGKLRILGPFRSNSQVELSATDARTIGVKAPIRLSGDISGTPGIVLRSPYGELQLEEGVIVAKRHIHMSENDASLLGLKQGDVVAVEASGDGRKIVFNDVVIRTGSRFNLEMHIDTDEANAGNITSAVIGRFI
ncbi:phosphate propanoyltransferase [Sporolactobacillus shoreicorticis]|uniref:Phosphate propanoyltransferase n=1 Tax=Sporolactobacillus shoreicorticis TaxID=1923877 RepID=A0ABW5S456_9BACL|nr:phosphate propanoyltransferase [Sporolactobacillus shoreicorticis]MCO7124439.1 phosphate propanoyltransferase [Sporolactobacillus shoreicorticis]